jgi:hypothetical protein
MNFTKWLVCLAVSTLSTAALAEVNACDVVKCGDYTQGPDQDGMGLTISFQPGIAKNEIAFGWIFTKNGVDTGGGVRLTLKLADDGSFTALEGKNAYAAGVCGQSACTYGMFPHKNNDGTAILQTGTFKFSDDKLEVSVFAPAAENGKDFVSKGVLDKKK